MGCTSPDAKPPDTKQISVSELAARICAIFSLQGASCRVRGRDLPPPPSAFVTVSHSMATRPAPKKRVSKEFFLQSFVGEGGGLVRLCVSPHKMCSRSVPHVGSGSPPPISPLFCSATRAIPNFETVFSMRFPFPKIAYHMCFRSPLCNLCDPASLSP